MKWRGSEQQRLPREEAEGKPDQGMLQEETNNEQGHLVPFTEEDRWRHLNQQLAELGVRITFHVVLEPDPERTGQLKRTRRWVIVEQEPDESHEQTDGDELLHCSE